MKNIYLILIFLLPFQSVSAQQNDSLFFLQEQVFQDETDAQWLEDHYQQLQELADHPVNIHEENLKILIELQLMSELQLFYLRAYLQKHKQIRSVYELEFIEGFTSEDVQRLTSFVEVKPLNNSVSQSFSKKKKIYGQASISSDFRSGTADSLQIGLPAGMKLSSGLKMGKQWQVGFLAENDRGEKMQFAQNQSGFDHYAGFLRYLSPSGKWQWIAGNYKLVSGQGAGYSSVSMSFISMDQPFALKRFHRGFRPYVGTEENNQLQGLAWSYQNPIIEAGIYLSSHLRDAGIDSSYVITNLSATGNHADSAAFAKRKVLRESRAGAYLLLKMKALYTGIHADLLTYPYPIESKTGIILPAWSPFLTSSLDYQFPLQRAHFFGEIALQPNGLLQQVHGMEYSPVSSLQLGIKYQEAACNPLISGLADYQLQGNSGDQRYTIGVAWSANRSIRLSFSGEWQKRRLNDSSLDAPSGQSGLQLRISYTPAKKSAVFLQLRRNLSELPQENELYFNFPTNYRTVYQLRIQAKHSINETISLLLRIDRQLVYSTEDQPFEGSLLLQGVEWNYRNKLALHFRYMLYLTDSYETSYRLTETDLPGYYSGVSLSGRGNRFYIMVKYKISDQWNIACKWGETFYLSGYTIGTADTANPGFSAAEFKCMLTYRINPK